ncbi:MAG TPA: dienelactone hydrolase family protein [Lysobacter sp.]|nr:dienelactone hydrolase family protein [Lysobacter sp.]
MGRWIALDTPHGTVRAWRAEPATAPRGAVVVVQEIFGVNAHIRDVAQRFAAAGWRALAPAVLDPVEADVELDYDESGVQHGRALVAELGFDRAVDIVGAAATVLRNEGAAVGAVGFCWGGTVAFLANTRLGLPAVSYYGGRSVPFLDEATRAPMLFHFGERDPIIPPEHVELHRAKQPQATIHVYPAGHGFNCDRRGDYHADSATLAWERTLAFLDAHVR